MSEGGYEQANKAEEAVRTLLQHLGEDPQREGLQDTPKRVVKALQEMTTGYRMEPAEALGTTFNEQHDNLVLLKGIRYTSLCEHHMLPFIGTASVGYIPGDCIVGLSKLARIVDVFARRLQVQERMTEQIAYAINEHIRPKGVGVVIRGHHSCMGCRGVRQQDAEMTTSCMLGVMRDSPQARNELLTLE
tara:strand:+ start:5884 stop:6450 length:567 start_codon:yes stop_codon:yes gene_type:complete